MSNDEKSGLPIANIGFSFSLDPKAVLVRACSFERFLFNSTHGDEAGEVRLKHFTPWGYYDIRNDLVRVLINGCCNWITISTNRNHYGMLMSNCPNHGTRPVGFELYRIRSYNCAYILTGAGKIELKDFFSLFMQHQIESFGGCSPVISRIIEMFPELLIVYK